MTSSVCRKRILLVWLLLSCLTASPLLAAPAKTSGPLWVVLLPGTSLTDWELADAPHLHHLLTYGTLAVMNTRAARLVNDHTRETPKSAALTLGAASRAAGGAEAADFHSQNARVPGMAVTYGELYARRMGVHPLPDCWVDAEWPHVMCENQAVGYDLLPGALGDALGRHRVALTAGGGRFAFPIACRSDGTVLVVTDTAVTSMSSGCVIWDAGANIPAADTIIGKIMAQAAVCHGHVLILSPFVSNAAYAQGHRLAPVALWGDAVSPGLLYSPSTHRAGLVTNTDFAPTVTALFGADSDDTWLHPDPFGRAWTVRATPAGAQIADVAALEQQAYAQGAAQRVLPIVALVLGLALCAGIFQFSSRRASVPLSSLPIALVLALTISTSVVLLAANMAVALVAAYALQRYGREELFNITVATAIVVILGTDMCLGDPLMHCSLLGYSAVEGARYYGLGNEAMGALVGAVLVTATSFWPHNIRVRLLTVGIMAGLTLLIVSPLGGAKAGGLLVSIVAYATFVWTALEKTWNVRSLATLFVMLLVGLALASAGELHPGRVGGTHIGQAVHRIQSGGLREAADIVGRKLGVESRLLYHSAWAVPLWIGIGTLGIFRMRADQLLPSRRALLTSGGAAVAACLAFNDAGVVAAALCGAVIWSGLIGADTNKNDLRPHDAIKHE